MKRYLVIISLFLASSFAFSQQDTRPTSYIGISVEGGYSHLFFGDIWKPTSGGATPLSGWGAGAALSYELEVRHFLFHTGFGMDYLSSTNRLPAFTYSAAVKEYSTMQYHYTFNDFRETSSYAVAYVPVMVGGKWDKWFCLAGTKVGFLPFLGSTKPKSEVTTWASDADIIDDLYDLPTHNMTSFSIAGSSQAINYPNLNVMLSAEIGLNLDRRIWMNEQERQRMDRAQRFRNMRRKKSIGELTHYRISLFADYGISNLHTYSPNPVAYGTESQGGIIAFNGLTDLTPYSMLGYAPYKEVALHNWLVGVKLTVNFEMPKPAPKKGVMAYPYLYVYTNDEVTTKPLAGARVHIVNAKTGKVRLDKPTSSKTASVSKGLPVGPYKVYVARSGYFPHDTIYYEHRDDYDTLYVSLYPESKLAAKPIDKLTLRGVPAKVKLYSIDNHLLCTMTADSINTVLSFIIDDRNTYILKATADGYRPYTDKVKPYTTAKDIKMDPIVLRSFILHNMFFATAKTKVLSSSEGALQELYDMLSENPDIRIRIVGHTDDVGSEAFNETLSERRAKSIKAEMVKRGIDAKRIVSVGHGEYEPIVPNDSDEHRQMNRRVEIVIISGTLKDAKIVNKQMQK